MKVHNEPLIDPSWPAPFNSGEWWADSRIMFQTGAEPAIKGQRRRTHKPWTDDQLREAARWLQEGEPWEAAAYASGHSFVALRGKIAACGGRDAFIAKYARQRAEA